MTRFIALDPSTTFTGWAVFQDDGLVAWGKIILHNIPYSFRFQYVVNELIHLTQVYHVTEIAIEDVSFAWRGVNRNRNIAGLQSIFRSIQVWAKGLDLPFTAYNPAKWKYAVVGHRSASKEVTKNNVRYRFPRLPVDLTDHEFDAIAIGVYHGELRKLEAMTEGGS